MRLISLRSGAMTLVLAIGIAAAGCMGPQTPPARPAATFSGGYRTQTLNTDNLQTAFAAAEGAVADYFKIASADPATGVITFQPEECTRIGGARMRRVGKLAVYKAGGAVVASIQIENQRYVTPGMQALSNTLRADDRPGVTPIQEEGGLTPTQREYWNTESRDAKMEAEILQRTSEAINATQRNATQPASQRPVAAVQRSAAKPEIVTVAARRHVGCRWRPRLLSEKNSPALHCT